MGVVCSLTVTGMFGGTDTTTPCGAGGGRSNDELLLELADEALDCDGTLIILAVGTEDANELAEVDD
tara:strand:+ start:2196 stop:2396 length:201 start_codon:yes stop_codon:yes gene_type:complete